MNEPVRSPPVGYWALAPVLAQLRRELLAAFPDVPASAYGTIGDANHKARHSDHNPDPYRYVRALDIPYVKHAGPPLDELGEFLRQVGAGHSQRLVPGGYVIWNRRVVSTRTRWVWATYMGDSPHQDHLHVSCSLLPHLYCGSQRWDVAHKL